MYELDIWTSCEGEDGDFHGSVEFSTRDEALKYIQENKGKYMLFELYGPEEADSYRSSYEPFDTNGEYTTDFMGCGP